MEIRFKDRKNAIEVSIKGKLDIDQAELFENEFSSNALKSKEKNIGVNLAQVEYIDSSGLGALIKVLNAVKNEGKSMFLFGAAPKIQNVFQLARLEKFFAFTSPVEFKSKFPDSDDEAIDDLINKI